MLFETGPRLAATLADLAALLGPREAAIGRELTKLYEEVRRGTLEALAAAYAGAPAPRGEIVMVVAPPGERAPTSEADLDALLRDALERASVKDAVEEVATIAGRARRDVYQRALALKRESPDGAAD